jgi:hypothetical protein
MCRLQMRKLPFLWAMLLLHHIVLTILMIVLVLFLLTGIHCFLTDKQTATKTFYTYTDESGIHIKHLQTPANTQIEIYNVLGQRVFENKNPVDDVSSFLPLALNTQVYFVCVITDEKRVVSKVIY